VSVSRDLQVVVTSRRRSCHGDHVSVVCTGDHDDDDDDDVAAADVQLGSSSRPAAATYSNKERDQTSATGRFLLHPVLPADLKFGHLNASFKNI